ncbi:amidohydrolase [candidate division TA06 bacterium]|nr:amidohydrolase [candidate division TA06 bacterium]
MEYLITNGKIFTMDAVHPEVGGILVRDGKIAKVFDSFSDFDIRNSEFDIQHSGVIDLEGKTLLPGFIDSHVHLLHTGLSYMDVNLEGAENLEEVFERIVKNVKLTMSSAKLTSGQPILRAGQLAPEILKEKRYPTRAELDGISEEIPIYVRRRDGHSSVVNTKGLEFLRLPEEIEGADRENGILKRQANGWAWRCFLKCLSGEEKSQAFRKACKAAIRKGLTSLNVLDGNEDPKRDDIEVILQLQDELSCDLIPFFQTTDVRRVEKLSLPRIGGCVSLDGSIGSHSAALFEPYVDEPENRGRLYFEDQELEAFVRNSVERGLQVTVHAIGDRAVEQILKAYEKQFKIEKSNHRCRIEHAEILTEDQIGRISDSGITLSMQPAFEEFWGGSGKMYEERLGKERAKGMNPFRRLLDHGIKVCGGSDSPITPLDPLLGIHSAVNHPTPESRVAVEEATGMFTTTGAWACFREKEIGKIAQGFQADFVVLSEDLFSVSSEKIREIEILKVIRKGEVAYEKGDPNRVAQALK